MVQLNRLVLLSATTAVTALPEPFDAREATVETIHNALFSGLTSCRGVVSAFIARVEAFNPALNAVIALNPDVLAEADELDMQLASGNITGKPLFCAPILLKDNFDAVGLPTTGACKALADMRPTTDAPTVAAFKKAGGLILGKTNLHELALDGLSTSSLGGQTLNPYDFTRTPGGSSGGTGTAVAASLGLFGTGSDTVNSLRSPASANNLYSLRPTRGLISRSGVIPAGYTQDTIGVITRNLKDLAIATTVMASVGYDSSDNATALIPKDVMGKDYAASLYGGTLKGKKLGLVQGFYNYTASNETTPVLEAMEKMVSLLEAAGAEIINVTDSTYNSPAIGAAMNPQVFEVRQLLDEYLGRSDLEGDFPRSVQELWGRGTDDFLLLDKNFFSTITASSTNNATYASRQWAIQNLTLALHNTFQSDQLDALIYPEQTNLVVKVGSASQSGRNGMLAALTGTPVVTIPMGFSNPSEDAPIGVPMGMEILGLHWTEDKLLNMAQNIANLAPMRRMPTFSNGSVEVRDSEYAKVPVIEPNSDNIPPSYSLGG